MTSVLTTRLGLFEVHMWAVNNNKPRSVFMKFELGQVNKATGVTQSWVVMVVDGQELRRFDTAYLIDDEQLRRTARLVLIAANPDLPRDEAQVENVVTILRLLTTW